MTETTNQSNQDNLSKRNYDAVKQALDQQNQKLQEFEDRLTALATQLQMINHEIEKLKERSVQDMLSQYGSGPTENS